jgi:hypothetical protein
MISIHLAAPRAAGAVALALVVAAAVAACGGTSAPGSAAAPSTAATNPPASASAAASVEASAAGQSLPPGVTGSAKWCLNTVDEVSAAVGTIVTTAAGSDAPGVGGGCVYTSAAGTPIYGISVVSPAPAGMFEGFKAGQGAESLSGIGDAAVLVTPGGPLVVLKGQTVASLVILPSSGMSDLAKARAALESLAKAAAGRM